MPREKIRKAVGYARVSTKEQAIDGVSLSDQVERIRAQILAKGMKISEEFGEDGIFVDDGYTGSNLDRPGLVSIIDLVERDKIDDVVVVRLDRIARTTMGFLSLMHLFREHGVGFHSITESLDSSTPAGKMVMTILATIAEYERELIRERINDALAFKKANDERLGTPPLGYKVMKNPKGGPGELVESPEEMAVLLEIKDCIDKKWSLSSIAKYLNGHGYKTKRRNNSTKESIWHASTVRYIVRNPKYAHIFNSETLTPKDILE